MSTTTAKYGRGKPYPASVMVRARELSEAGWYPVKIRQLLEAEGHPVPDLMTVKKWCDDRYARSIERASRDAKNKRVASTATFRLAGSTAAYRAAFVAALLEHGVLESAIPAVCTVVLGDRPVDMPAKRGTKTVRSGWSAQKAARLLARGLELREHGMSYNAISVAFQVFEGVEMTDIALRSWLTMHGAGRNANKRQGPTAPQQTCDR